MGFDVGATLLRRTGHGLLVDAASATSLDETRQPTGGWASPTVRACAGLAVLFPALIFLVLLSAITGTTGSIGTLALLAVPVSLVGYVVLIGVYEQRADIAWEQAQEGGRGGRGPRRKPGGPWGSGGGFGKPCARRSRSRMVRHRGGVRVSV